MKNWDGSLNFGTVAKNQCGKPKEQADWQEIERKARVVETALRLYGKGAARRLWHELGLPDVPGVPRPLPDALLLSHVDAFMSARIVPDDSVRLAAGDLHQAYLDWATNTGAAVLTLQMLGRLMNYTGIPKFRARNTTYGARLVAPSPRNPAVSTSEKV